MAQERVQRRLAAILAADIVGYSRLMGADEAGTLARLKTLRRELLDPKAAEYSGRIVKTMGDGVLIEFPSAVDAVQHAIDVQGAMARREADTPDDQKIELRMGINLGDVIVEDDDIYGDGVNVAARLEGLAEPGGVIVSGMVHEAVRAKLDCSFDDLGLQEVKNIAEPVQVYAIQLFDIHSTPTASKKSAPLILPEVKFCKASDDVNIAYATAGQGPPLVKAANWLSQLEFDWQSPVWRHFMQAFAEDYLFVRYDMRGNGLSDWDVDDISFEAFVSDLETVVDAAGLDQFALLGISQGSMVSVTYAARHPERVSHLVLCGGMTCSSRRRGSPEQIEQAHAMTTLMRHGWGQDNPAFRQMFTSRLIPEATMEQMQWFNDLQKNSTTPENVIRIRQAFSDPDVSELLSEIIVPTLIIHSRDEVSVPFDEGRKLATMIPDAQFVALESQNHILLENEPAWPRFLEAVNGFLATVHPR